MTKNLPSKGQATAMPLALGIAFVAFTTQFGGGFASGAQIYSYFIRYGIWCLIFPAITQGLYAFFFRYGMRYSYQHKAFDYRTFSDKFYGKTRYVMSNLHEICYLIMIFTASAAAFATGGSTINSLLNIPYFLCTLLVAVFIFLVTMFGTKVVRRAASTLSVLILLGLLVVLVPNIIVQHGAIGDAHPPAGRGRDVRAVQRTNRRRGPSPLDGLPVFPVPAGLGLRHVLPHGCRDRQEGD